MNEMHYRNYVHALKDKDKCFDQFLSEILAVYEENDFTRIITTDDFIECLECGRRFHVKVTVTIEDVE